MIKLPVFLIVTAAVMGLSEGAGDFSPLKVGNKWVYLTTYEHRPRFAEGNKYLRIRTLEIHSAERAADSTIFRLHVSDSLFNRVRFAYPPASPISLMDSANSDSLVLSERSDGSIFILKNDLGVRISLNHTFADSLISPASYNGKAVDEVVVHNVPINSGSQWVTRYFKDIGYACFLMSWSGITGFHREADSLMQFNDIQFYPVSISTRKTRTRLQLSSGSNRFLFGRSAYDAIGRFMGKPNQNPIGEQR